MLYASRRSNYKSVRSIKEQKEERLQKLVAREDAEDQKKKVFYSYESNALATAPSRATIPRPTSGDTDPPLLVRASSLRP